MGLRITLPAALVTLLAACTGGPGSGEDGYQTTQDRAPSSQDGVSSTTEQAARSNEGVATTNESGGTQGATGGSGGTLDCTGSYRCVITAEGQSINQTISFKNGCTAEKAAFRPDGTITDEDGKTAGTYTVTPGGFKVSGSTETDKGTVAFTYDCTRTSDAAGDDDDDDKTK